MAAHLAEQLDYEEAKKKVEKAELQRQLEENEKKLASARFKKNSHIALAVISGLTVIGGVVILIWNFKPQSTVALPTDNVHQTVDFDKQNGILEEGDWELQAEEIKDFDTLIIPFENDYIYSKPTIRSERLKNFTTEDNATYLNDVYVDGEPNGWVYVDLNGTKGYANLKYSYFSYVGEITEDNAAELDIDYEEYLQEEEFEKRNEEALQHALNSAPAGEVNDRAIEQRANDYNDYLSYIDKIEEAKKERAERLELLVDYLVSTGSYHLDNGNLYENSTGKYITEAEVFKRTNNEDPMSKINEVLANDTN